MVGGRKCRGTDCEFWTVVSKYLDSQCAILSLESYSFCPLPPEVNLACDFAGTNVKHLISVVLTVLLSCQQSYESDCSFLDICYNYAWAVMRTETSGTLMRLGLDWHAPFLVQGKRVEPHLWLWSAVHEFSFSEPRRGVWGGKDSCSFIKGSDNNCINLIFTSHLPEKDL